MGNGRAKPPPLPSAAPTELKKFVACKVPHVELDAVKLDWIPDGPLGDFAPDATITPGAQPNQATIGYGLLELPATVNAAGELEVDTSSVPASGPLSFLTDAIDGWVNDFNATLKANNKRLDSVTFKGTTVVLEKAPLTPPVDKPVSAGTTLPATTPPPTTPASTPPAKKPAAPKPRPQPQGGFFSRWWRWLIGLLVLCIVLVVLIVAFTTGSTNDAQTTTVSSTDTAPVPTQTPIPEPADTDDAESGEDPDTESDPDTDTENVEGSDTTESSASDDGAADDAPTVQLTADFFAIDPFTSVELYDLDTGDRLDTLGFDTPLTIDFFVRQQAIDGQWPFAAVISPPIIGALEVWTSGDATPQPGGVVFFPDSTDFDTFSPAPQLGQSFPCETGTLVVGSIGGQDPRSLDSWGINLLVPGGGQNAVGSNGAFLGGNPGSEVQFDVGRRIGLDTWNTTDSVVPCVNDPANFDAVAASDFFLDYIGDAPSLEPVPTNTPSAEELENRVSADDPLGDVVACDDNTALDRPGGDLRSVTAERRGDDLFVSVVTGRSPTQTVDESWSWAVVMQLATEGGQQRGFVNQFHDGVPTTGEFVGDDIVPGRVETSFDNSGVFFNIELDPADPPSVLVAQVYNTPAESDLRSCDELFLSITGP